jgi:hypothetical protein
MTDFTFADIEADRKQCEEVIARGAKFEKLFKNREFKELILEGYFKEELIRLTDLLAVVNDEQKTRVQAEIEAIARVKQYMEIPARFAEQAKDHLVALKDAEEELRAEQDAELLAPYEG